MKRILIGTLIFLLYLALVIAGAFALHFEGLRFWLFLVLLGLLGALATGFALWYLHKLSKANAPSDGPETPDSINLDALLRDADARIRSAGRAGAKSLAAMPLVYVIGDENSAKTQTVLQSGLDPELLVGNVYQDGSIVPTQLANLWLAGSYVLVEAGGALLRQPALWLKLIKATIPAQLGSVFAAESRLPPRSVVVCVSIERILAPNTSEQIRALAQSLNERLRKLSQTLGISLPVYILFTKLDNIAPFADYMARLSEEEVKMPIGSLLSSINTASGIYTEQATALIGTRFDQLLYALAEFRLDVLSRGGALDELARAYEFPRDLRKLRAGIVAFLAEVARPSQIGVNPFLRGFFFAGMRAHLVEDVLEIGPAQAQPQAEIHAGATRIFSLAAAQPQQPVAQSRRGGTRKVAQWVFLPHLFSRILLADKSALESSRASTRTSFLKRALLACASSFLLLILLLATISFFRNHALEERVAKAAAVPVYPVSSGQYAAVSDLQSLDKLRALVEELARYRQDGPPLFSRMGLFRGNELYPIACQAYSTKFRALLLAPTQENILAKLRAVPYKPTPEDDYGASYRSLKAYILTTSATDPDTAQDTVEFLPNQLLAEWTGSQSPSSDQAALAQAQFAFYAGLLPGPASCMARAGGVPNDVVISHARAYLNGFQGFQQVYQSMLAAANRKVPGFNYNAKFPGSAEFVSDTYPIPGAFTKDGFTFMQNAIAHPDPYFRGEEWVLGPASGPAIDRLVLSDQLRKAYFADYIQIWRSYLTKAQFIPYHGFPDAAVKLGALDSNTSAILELFSLISTNTAVAAPEIASAFQAPQSVVTPNITDNRLIGPANQPYIQALQTLESNVKSMSIDPTKVNDPALALPVSQAALVAEQAVETMRIGFTPDPAGAMDKASFNILEAPIKSIESLAAQAPVQAASGGQKAFCQQIAPTMAKFPLNPQGSVEATTDEMAQIFAPSTGAFAQYAAKQSAFVTLQGAQYRPIPGSTIHVSNDFLAFMNTAQKIASTLYASGNQPTLDFTLTEVKAPGVSDANLSIDGKTITTGGQTASFHWVSSPNSKITLATQKNTAPPIMVGPWAVFHFGFTAPQIAPNRMKFTFSFNNQNPEVVLFDASGNGAALLNPEFMKNLHRLCERSAVSR